MAGFNITLYNGVCFAVNFRKREEYFTALFINSDDANNFYDSLHDSWNEMSKPYKATVLASPVAGVKEFDGKTIEFWNEFYKAHHFCFNPSIGDYFKL